MKYKMVGGVRIGENQKMWYRTSAGNTWSGVKLSVGALTTFPTVLWLTGHSFSASDLLPTLASWCTVVATAIGGGFAAPTFTLDPDTGIITFARGAIGTNYFEISCYKDGLGANLEDNSANVWGVLFPELANAGTFKLALSGAGSQSWVASEHHGFALYPVRYFVEDVRAQNHRAAQMRSMGPGVNTVRAATMRELHYKLRMTSSYPRSMVQNELHALEDFLDQAATGLPVMIFPDRDGVGGGYPYAFEPKINPYGWHRGVLRSADADFEPQPEQANWLYNFPKSLRFYVQTPSDSEWL